MIAGEGIWRWEERERLTYEERTWWQTAVGDVWRVAVGYSYTAAATVVETSLFVTRSGGNDKAAKREKGRKWLGS